MLRIKECKALARRTLLGRYKTVIAAYFITIAITALLWILTSASGFMTFVYAGVLGGSLGTGIAFSFPKLVCGVMLTMFLLLATVIVSLWFEIGSTRLMLNICRGLKASVKDVFYGFREGSNTLCYILTGVVISLITFAVNVAQKLLYVLAKSVLPNQTAHTAAIIIITVIALLAMWYIATAFIFAKIVIADKRESTIGGALAASRRLMKGRKLKGFWLIYFSFLFWDILMFICGPAALWISPYILCTTVIFYMDADGTLWQLPGEDTAPYDNVEPVDDTAPVDNAVPTDGEFQDDGAAQNNVAPQANAAAEDGNNSIASENANTAASEDIGGYTTNDCINADVSGDDVTSDHENGSADLDTASVDSAADTVQADGTEDTATATDTAAPDDTAAPTDDATSTDGTAPADNDTEKGSSL